MVFHTYQRIQRPPQTVKGIEPCVSVLALVYKGILMANSRNDIYCRAATFAQIQREKYICALLET